MSNDLDQMIIVSVFILIIMAGAIVGQIFLSKAENKYLGLILPLVTLIFATIMALNVMVPQGGSLFGAVWLTGRVFMLCNIPTAILIAIYFAVRGKKKRISDVQKMTLQDLD